MIVENSYHVKIVILTCENCCKARTKETQKFEFAPALRRTKVFHAEEWQRFMNFDVITCIQILCNHHLLPGTPPLPTIRFSSFFGSLWIHLPLQTKFFQTPHYGPVSCVLEQQRKAFAHDILIFLMENSKIITTSINFCYPSHADTWTEFLVLCMPKTQIFSLSNKCKRYYRVKVFSVSGIIFSFGCIFFTRTTYNLQPIFLEHAMQANKFSLKFNLLMLIT